MTKFQIAKKPVFLPSKTSSHLKPKKMIKIIKNIIFQGN
jgi:hypothetical protein